jgi:hypothetical protein
MPLYNFDLDTVLNVGNTSTTSIRIPTANLTAYHVGLAGTSDSSTIILDMSETSSTTTAGIRSVVEHTGSTGIMRAMQFTARHNGTAIAQSPLGGQFTASLAVKNAGTAQVTALQGTATLEDTVSHSANATNLQNIFECTDNGAVITGGIINARSVWAKEPAAYTGAATIRRWAILSSGDVQINTNKRLLLGGGDASVGTNYLLGTGSLIETYINSVKVCDFSSTALTLADGYNIAGGSTTGSKLGLSSTDKWGFFGATPVARPAAYTQTFATASRTVPNPTATVPAATNTLGGWGFASSAEMTTFVNEIKNLITDDENLRKNINALIDDHQSLGFAG